MGKLDAKKTNVGTGVVGAPACGDVMKFQIEVDEDGKIVEAKFKTFGCGSAIASSSLATEWVKGKSIDQAASTVAERVDTRKTQVLLLLGEVVVRRSLGQRRRVHRTANDGAVRVDDLRKLQCQPP